MFCFGFFFTDGGKSCFQACSHAMVVLPCETDADGSLSHRCLLLFPREDSTCFPLFVLAPAFLASVPSAAAWHNSPFLVDRLRCETADMEEEYFLQETLQMFCCSALCSFNFTFIKSTGHLEIHLCLRLIFEDQGSNHPNQSMLHLWQSSCVWFPSKATVIS